MAESVARTRLHLVTGFLGSGKTSVLLHLLGGAHPEGQLGVLVGEYSDEGYDGPQLEQTGHSVEMIAGLDGARGDGGGSEGAYLGPLKRMLTARSFPRVIIETSGATEASRLRDALRADPELTQRAQWDKTLVVVDAGAFVSHRKNFEPQLRAQLDVADLVAVNKTDKVGPEELQSIRSWVHEINPDAAVQFSYMGQLHRTAYWAPFEEGQRPRILTSETQADAIEDFESFVYRTPAIAYDRLQFGHRLLNLTAQIARFKGVLQSYDRCYAINGLPGQLDWENRPVRGATRIAIIGLGIESQREEIVAALDAELAEQKASFSK